MDIKYRAYLDENGHTGLSKSTDINSRYLTITGAIFELQYVAEVLFPEVEQLKRRFFRMHHPDAPVILHSNEIKGKRWPFDCLKDHEVCERFDHELIRLLDKFDFTVISVTIDKKAFHEHYQHWNYDYYHLCILNFIERYYMFLQDHQAKGDVMIESRNNSQDKELKQLYNSIYAAGTNRIKNLKDLITSGELKIKPKASNISGLQIADIISGPIRQYVLANYYSEKTFESSFCKKLFETVQPKIRQSATGKILGYGLKAL